MLDPTSPKTDGWMPTLRGTVLALAAIGLCSGVCAVILHFLPAFAPANVIMIHLAGVALVAARSGRGQAMAAAVLSVLSFDFFFVDPRLSFAVGDAQYLVTFAVMLGVALLIATQTRRIRAALASQAAQAVEKAQLAAAAREEAAKAEFERLRGTLLSSMSHDLRTPLSVIIGDSEQLMNGTCETAEERRALAAGIHAETVRLDRLVGNLLDITRLEAGPVNPRREVLPAEEIIGATLARSAPEWEGRDIETQVPAELPMVSVDAVLAGQALFHLLENAGRYSPPGTPITVKAQLERMDDASFVVIHVLDHGPGLKPGEAEKIFDKCFRGAAAVGKPGTGLGLAICRAIMQVHGGRVSAANREGGGADFSLWLPAAKELP